jgi:transposase
VGEWESDPDKIIAMMLGIPGATVIELRATDDASDVLIETERRQRGCPECKGPVEPSGRVLEELEPSSVGGKVSRVTWRRRRWRCPSPDCSMDTFLERDSGVDEFNERVGAANRRFPLRAVQTPPSDWSDRLEE